MFFYFPTVVISVVGKCNGRICNEEVALYHVVHKVYDQRTDKEIYIDVQKRSCLS